MDARSSASSASSAVHKKDLEPVTSSTEANGVPRTSDSAEVDLEKSQEKPGSGPAVPVAAPPGGIDPSSYPDGGLEAWLVVLGTFCCLFVSFGWINCIGVFQDYYQTHQLSHLSPSTVSWISSLELFMMFLGGPIIGKLYDNYGPRYILLFGSILHVFGLMMASLSTKYYQFILSQGICSPIGASAIFYPALNVIGTWFFKNRAAAFGVMTSGSSLGGVIFPIMIQRLIPEVGFGWTMRIAAFLILGLLVIANLTVKSRLPPHPKPLVLMEFVRPLKEIPYLLIVIGSFIFFIGLFVPFTFIILQARESGMSSKLAQYLVPILNAASIFGRILPGIVADRVGRFNVMMITTFFSGVIVLALWLPSRSNAPVIVFAALYGFASGAFVTLQPALIAQISDIRQIGVRMGTLFAIVSVAGLIGGPISGELVSRANGTYHTLQIFCGVLLLGGASFFLAARTSLVGPHFAKKV